MQQQLHNETPGGWLTRIVGAVVGAVVMVGLFFLGLTVFAVVVGLAVVVFTVLAVRVWWLRRQFRRRYHEGAAESAAGNAGADRKSGNGVTLEGEYEERRRD